jgi:hypothetical protein
MSVEKFVVTTHDEDRSLDVHSLDAIVISREDFNAALRDAYQAGQRDMEMRR